MHTYRNMQLHPDPISRNVKKYTEKLNLIEEIKQGLVPGANFENCTIILIEKQMRRPRSWRIKKIREALRGCGWTFDFENDIWESPEKVKPEPGTAKSL